MNGYGGLRVTAAGLKLRRPYLPDSVGELRLRSLAWRGGHVTLVVSAQGAGALVQAVAVLDGPSRCLVSAAGVRQTLISGGAAVVLPPAYSYPAMLEDGVG